MTSPAPSCPSTAGTTVGIVPFMPDRSEWHTPVAAMRTRTWPGPGPVGRDVVGNVELVVADRSQDCRSHRIAPL